MVVRGRRRVADGLEERDERRSRLRVAAAAEHRVRAPVPPRLMAARDPRETAMLWLDLFF